MCLGVMSERGSSSDGVVEGTGLSKGRGRTSASLLPRLCGIVVSCERGERESGG